MDELENNITIPAEHKENVSEINGNDENKTDEVNNCESNTQFVDTENQIADDVEKVEMGSGDADTTNEVINDDNTEQNENEEFVEENAKEKVDENQQPEPHVSEETTSGERGEKVQGLDVQDTAAHEATDETSIQSEEVTEPTSKDASTPEITEIPTEEEQAEDDGEIIKSYVVEEPDDNPKESRNEGDDDEIKVVEDNAAEEQQQDKETEAVEEVILPMPDNVANVEGQLQEMHVEEMDENEEQAVGSEETDPIAVEECDMENDDTATENAEDSASDLMSVTLEETVAENEVVVGGANLTTGGSTTQRGRKCRNEIPLYVVGHDLGRPGDNTVNGRTIKPRLGVKVPPRTLSSQIVSKEEITKEIIERCRRKSASGDVTEVTKKFAGQLTRRLADKIVPSIPKAQKQTTTATGSAETDQAKEDTTSSTVIEIIEESSNSVEEDGKNAHDNSDLLAILEGEGDDNMPVLSKENEPVSGDETNIVNLEREIALQQLSDLPFLTPKQRAYRGRYCKDNKTPVPRLVVEKKSPVGGNPRTEPVTVNKENSKSPATPVSPKKDSSPKKVPIEEEPQIKVNMALKTYSRKRKSPVQPEMYPEAKRNISELVTDGSNPKSVATPNLSGDVYITKSSRVIKRKVIWDPDEVPARSLKSTLIKHESPPVPKQIKSEKTPDVRTKVEKKEEKVTVKKPNDTGQKKNVEITPKKVDTPLKKIPESPVKKSPLDSTQKKSSIDTTQKKDSLQKKPDTTSDKRNSISPGSKALLKAKKGRTEVDRLLGDEGAIKMLYELKNTDETDTKRRVQTVISVDKTYKDLAKKANEIKSELTNNSAAVELEKKSLRKKDTLSPVISQIPKPPPPVLLSATAMRHKSKDSTRSTPPRSPSYTYPNSEVTYLIRRRSSSSFSSNADDDANDDKTPLALRMKPKRAKRSSESGKKESVATDGVTKSRTSLPSPFDNNANKEKVFTDRQQSKVDSKFGSYGMFNVKKVGKQVTIDLNYGGGACYFTFKLLVDLSHVLSKIALEKDCNVVLLKSSGPSFCLGLDYTFLVADNEVDRKKKATELAWEVSNFLKCLLYFPKVLVAGIQGHCVGLAVTMLPLFDFVIASDSSSFSTPYSRLGCMAEGGFLLTVPHISNHGLASDLLFTSQTLTADDVFRRGLVSKLCWPEKYQDSLKSLLVDVAKGSRQSLEATKKHLKFPILSNTSSIIESMEKQLIQHWTSAECQKNFENIHVNDDK